MTDEQKAQGRGLILVWVIIIGLIIVFFSACVQKITPISSKPIPITTIVVKPDSTRTYNTTYIRYFDSVIIYLKPVKQ
jgi:hypothetical protein